MNTNSKYMLSFPSRRADDMELPSIHIPFSHSTAPPTVAEQYLTCSSPLPTYARYGPFTTKHHKPAKRYTQKEAKTN